MRQTSLKKKFASLMCCMLSLTCTLGSIPASASTDQPVENLALHCSYETSGAPSADYPDSGGELTDGIEGTSSYGDSAWSAYLYVADLEITVDLGESKDFSKVEGVFLNSINNGGIPYPEWVRFSYSNDKDTWTEIVQESFADTAPADTAYTYSYELPETVNARYVKLTFPTAGWVFVSEIRVWSPESIVEPPVPPQEDLENMALHQPYETSGAAHANYPDSGGELTDGVEGTSSYSDPAWSAYLWVNNIEITVDLGSTKELSKLEGVFLNSMNNGGIPYPEWVKFSYSDDKQTWTDLPQETFHDTAPADSTYTYKYELSKPVNARYVKLTAPTGGWVFISEIRAWGKDASINPPEPPEPPVESDSLIFGIPYTSTLQGDAYHGSYGDPARTKLTDGKKSGAWDNANSVGIYSNGANQYFELTYALDETIQFKQIDIGVLTAPKSGISIPSQIVIQTRKEGETDWTTLYIGKPDGEGSRVNLVFATEGESLSAKEIRFGIEGGNTWTFLDELEVLADYNEETPQYVIKELPPPDDSNNIAKGRPYEVSLAADNAYPDEKNISLTDGVKGRLSYQDPAWVGYHAPADETVQEIVVDLGESQSFQEVALNVLQDSPYGIYYPDLIAVYTSDDKKTWTRMDVGASQSELILDLGSQQSFERIKTGFLQGQGKSDAAGIYNYCYQAPEQVKGRYVKVTMTFNTWAFIDEIQVFQVAETQRPKTANVLDDNLEPVAVDSNNAAYGATYETTWPSNDIRPDQGNKLTDGRRGSNSYLSKEWVGYTTADGIGAYLAENKVSARYPGSVSIFYSNNKENWSFLSNVNIAGGDTAEGVKRLDYVLEKAVSARYLKFVYYGLQDGLYMDEIEVLKVNDHKEDAGENPDNGDLVNLIENYDYTASRGSDEADIATALTDTLRGEGNWARLDYNAGYEPENHVVLNFDLTDMNSVSQIVMGMKRTGENVALPKNLKIKVSYNNSDWFTLKDFGRETPSDDVIWDGAVDEFGASIENADMAYTRYIRIEFDLTEGSATCLDEVQIFGKRGKTSTAGRPMEPHGDHYNVALEKPYTITPEASPSDVPDTDGRELTDGIRATLADQKDPAWFGFVWRYLPTGNQDESWPLKSVVIDLQDVKSVTNVQTSCMSGYLRGKGYINQPFALHTYASMDGKTWLPLSSKTNNDVWYYGEGTWGDEKFGVVSYGWRATGKNVVESEDHVSDADMVAARYIRVDYEPVNWCCIDEIEVMGYDGQKEGALVANGTRKLENGQEYMKPGEKTDGIHDMLLVYNGNYGYDAEANRPVGDWSVEKFRPHLTYVNSENKAVDTMFDAVLFLALSSRYGNALPDISVDGDSPPSLKDWEWYIEKMFKEGGDVDNLNKAAEIASQELHNPDYKVKMVISIPGMPWSVTKFGTLNGRELDLSKQEDREYLLDWYIETIYQKFQAGNYEYIDFSGYYWLEENIVYSQESPAYAGKRVHELGMHYFWIPYYDASGNLWGQDFGFDAVAIQPNHYFDEAREPGSQGVIGNRRIERAAGLASYGQAGIEMEFDDRVASDDMTWANKYIDYLNGAIEYGYGGPDVYRNWYVGGYGLNKVANSDKIEARNLYDATYQLMKGTLTEKIPYVTEFHYAPSIDTGIRPGGGSSIGGGGSSGSGSVTPKPDDKPDPETPPTGDDNYTWEETDDGYKLKDADGEYVTGWAKVSGKWYYLDADGIRATGWQKVDNKWYYLKSDGVMATGWLKLGNTWYFLNAGGVMQTGWLY
ncbi:MAG: hypothetical protein DBY45_05825, partial [Clostridiales bacterium]